MNSLYGRSAGRSLHTYLYLASSRLSSLVTSWLNGAGIVLEYVVVVVGRSPWLRGPPLRPQPVACLVPSLLAPTMNTTLDLLIVVPFLPIKSYLSSLRYLSDIPREFTDSFFFAE